MSTKTLFLVALLLLAAGATRAQAGATALPWSAWQPARTPDGAPLSTVQYRWRSIAPCTPPDCQLTVQFRNTSNAPAQFHYSIHFDTSASQSKNTAKPITGDASLEASGKASGGSLSGTAGAGDTTASRVVTGTRITSVVVEMKDESSRSYTWGPYQYSLLFTGEILTPDATLNSSESLVFSKGVLTITVKRGGGGVDPSRTSGFGSYTQMCTPLAVHSNGAKTDDGTGESYIPYPLWQEDLMCEEGPAATILFLKEKDAASFEQVINRAKKR